MAQGLLLRCLQLSSPFVWLQLRHHPLHLLTLKSAHAHVMLWLGLDTETLKMRKISCFVLIYLCRLRFTWLQTLIHKHHVATNRLIIVWKVENIQWFHALKCCSVA